MKPSAKWMIAGMLFFNLVLFFFVLLDFLYLLGILLIRRLRRDGETGPEL